jgi:hypothetical protein
VSELRDAALDYIARGWYVFSLCPRAKVPFPGDHECDAPLHQHGHLDATNDPDIVRRLWAVHRDANIGIRTGIESGLLVVDRDDYHGGFVTWEALEAKYAAFPDSLRVRTGSGSLHLYLRHPGGRRISGGGAGRLGAGIDVKADGGYVAGPPSIHPNGNPYVWIDEDDSQLEDAPPWLLSLLGSYEPQRVDVSGVQVLELPEKHALIALGDLMDEALSRITAGASRHVTLQALFQQCRDNHLPVHVARSAIPDLLKHCAAVPAPRHVGEHELEAMLRWAYLRLPRTPQPVVRKALRVLAAGGQL